jgi:uncharacterized protein YfiM (DUF2279 family)
MACCSFFADAGLAQPAESTDDWLGTDKLQHAVFSAHLTLLSYKALRQSYHNTPGSSRAGAIFVVFSLGASKEVADSRKPNDRFSYKDLIADAVGIGVGLILGHNLK